MMLSLTTPSHWARYARELSGAAQRTANRWWFSSRPSTAHRVERWGFADVLLNLHVGPRRRARRRDHGERRPTQAFGRVLAGLGGSKRRANQLIGFNKKNRAVYAQHDSGLAAPLASPVFLRVLGVSHAAAGLNLEQSSTSANPCRLTQCLAPGRADSDWQFRVRRATPLNSRAQRAHGIGLYDVGLDHVSTRGAISQQGFFHAEAPSGAKAREPKQPTFASPVFLRALGILHAAAGLNFEQSSTPANPCRSTRPGTGPRG